MSLSLPAWETLPLLALKCVLECMDIKDMLAATSTCRHWRNSLLLYEGSRSCLKLNVTDDTNKLDFLIKLFRRRVKGLRITIGPEADEMSLNNFTLHILPQFLDSVNLREVCFVGPIYVTQDKMLQYVHLRRVIFETFVFKHAHSLTKLSVFGCGLNYFDEDDRYTSRSMAHYSAPLTFEEYTTPGFHPNTILLRNTVKVIQYSNIHHIVFEFELISTTALATLSELDNFRMLSLNIISKKGLCLPKVDWRVVTPLYLPKLRVAVNIIGLPPHKVQHIIDCAFRHGMPLISLKVMFCGTFYMKLIHHVTALYHRTLAELSWVDAPSRNPSDNRVKLLYDGDSQAGYNFVNPFIFLAWQCKRLKKLTVHGYWVSEYDLIGVTRLRDKIDIDVSAIFDTGFDTGIYREKGFLYKAMEPPLNDQYKLNLDGVHQVMKVVRDDRKARLFDPHGSSIIPISQARNWGELAPGLRADAAAEERAEYIVEQMIPFATKVIWEQWDKTVRQGFEMLIF